MKVTALQPWFGSKRSMAPRIIAELGPHKSYWEPFCGSCAVLLAKPPCSMETVSDLHGDLTNLAWVVQDEALACKLYQRIASTLPAEELYLSSQAICKSPFAGESPDLDRAYHYLFSGWLGRNGLAGTCRVDSQIAVRWTHNGGAPACRFRSVAESIPDWHRRLLNVLVLRRCGFALLESIEDQAGTAIYVDPPYLLTTRKGSRGSGRYLHEFTIDDHRLLASALARFAKARVVVSYYAAPELADLYPGWEIIDCSRPKHLSVQGRRGATKQDAPEVLLVNHKRGDRSVGKRESAADAAGWFEPVIVEGECEV